jgi:FtsP/CotA-like multicopper oxidase with cupredoxin domain
MKCGDEARKDVVMNGHPGRIFGRRPPLHTKGRSHGLPRFLAGFAGAVVLLHGADAMGQTSGPLAPADCLKRGSPMLWMPELVSEGGKLRGTIRVASDVERRVGTDTACANQRVRYFEGVNAIQPPIPPGAGPGAAPVEKFIDPIPGPTLRARLGDLVELTLLNHVDTTNFGASFDRGENAGACDKFGPGENPGKGYPENARDTFPNCFHGSSTANIHFHGTHTNPNSTGDNVFLFVRPSPRSNDNKPTVTAESVAPYFNTFFGDCERELGKSILSEWPKLWSDLPPAWTDEQKSLLKAYDLGELPFFPPAKPLPQQLLPEDEEAIKDKRWPLYYIGAFPYCFRLPEYTAADWPPPADHPLKMGQAPGTHWYHAHKHGSTALNVANSMTGAFIIEGASYDGALNSFYGKVGTGRDEVDWTRAQPVLVINQIGSTPNLARNATNSASAQPLSVNGRLLPKMTMRPGEVQLWRIVNTSSRDAVLFTGVYTAGATTKAPFDWMQVAQDGVQFADVNYQSSLNVPIFLAAGNRADVLVKAPLVTAATTYDVRAQRDVAKSNMAPTRPGPVLFSVEVSGTPPPNERQTQFIRKMPALPPFLQDIKDKEIKQGKTITFDSKKKGEEHQHTIDGVQFSEKQVGVPVFLDTAEEWKIVNSTSRETSEGAIDHPFHIHINPFQISEVFDPNEKLIDGKGAPLIDPKTGKPAVDAQHKPLDKYVFAEPTFPDLQCKLDLNNPLTWRDCHNTPISMGIWWDVFPIPTGRNPLDANNKPINGPDGKPIVIPGYFKMRSRFVDYPGLYVLHCHILAHEDRGMMTIVEVKPAEPLRVRHH